MKYNPEIHNRKSIRLKGYDYSQAGLYFITICVHKREFLFGKIMNGEMVLNDAGKLIDTGWLNLRNRFSNIELHEYITMPNHFHGILESVRTTVGENPFGESVGENPVGETAVGPTLVVAPDKTITPMDIQKGQPQGFAPTIKPLAI